MLFGCGVLICFKVQITNSNLHIPVAKLTSRIGSVVSVHNSLIFKPFLCMLFTLAFMSCLNHEASNNTAYL